MNVDNHSDLEQALPSCKVLPHVRHLGPCATFQTSCIPGEAVTLPSVPGASPGQGRAILCFSSGSAFTQTDHWQFLSLNDSVKEQLLHNAVERTRVQAYGHV